MELNEKGIATAGPWQQAGIRLPAFDRRAVINATRTAPEWLHFGASNLLRAFPAVFQQQLLEQGEAHTGIVVAEGYDYEILEKLNIPCDNLSLYVELRADGSLQKQVVGSIVEACRADSSDEAAFERLREIFAAPSLRVVSFTITEKGYSLRRSEGLLPDVQRDFDNGPARLESYMGKVASLLLHRYENGGAPLAMVSMDNCSHNGTRLYEAVLAFADEWQKRGHTEPGFAAWLQNPAAVGFPWSMIDKITPRPDETVQALLTRDGLQMAEGSVTAKNTFVAPFVNAEETQYLVIEDWFPAGRPPWDKAGVLFASRAVVEKTERMKVCTCLNPLHTALAILGCLLGYNKISAEMQDEDLLALIRQVGYVEGLPVVENPGVLDPREFLDCVVRVRFPNPYMPDTPQRIATDTSQKLGIRFGQTIKAYLADPSLGVERLQAIPFVLAAWCRYLLGVDDAGEKFTPSPDPRLEELQQRLANIRPGVPASVGEPLRSILRDKEIFGVDLVEVGLADRIEGWFARMLIGPGSVRAALQECIGAFSQETQTMLLQKEE